MIEPIAPLAPATPLQGPRVSSTALVAVPEALVLRPAMHGARQFIVQFTVGTALPDGDEIDCSPETLAGVFPDDVLRSLTFSTATAWLARLYPRDLAAALDEQAAGLPDDTLWPDLRRPGFSRYYRLRFTGGPDDGYILDTLSRAATVSAAQLELAVVPLASAVKHADPEYANQHYLQAAPKGISVESAWNEGAGGAGITVSLAEHGGPPSSHNDIAFRKPLAVGATFSEHMVNVSAIMVAKDNADGIVGVSPISGAALFAAIDALPPPPSKSKVEIGMTGALALLAAPGVLSAGDVVNMSIGALVELDQKAQPNIVKGFKKAPFGSTWQKVFATVPVEFDAAVIAVVRQLVARGITVCVSAGNGYEATYTLKGNLLRANTGQGAELSGPWVGQTHSLDRANPSALVDGGAVVVTGGTWSPSKSANERILNLNFGTRVDCFARGDDVLTWYTNSVKAAGGSSVAAPIVTGAAALVQCYLKQNYQATLKPLVLRALLSDPLLNTPAQPNDRIGVMPNLAKIFPLLKTTPFTKAALAAAIKSQAGKLRAGATTPAQPSAPSASGPWVHDPYRTWDESAKKWVQMALDKEEDVFQAAP